MNADGGKSLVFRVGAVELALADGQVCAILPDPQVIPIPAMGNGVTGLLQASGALRYVVDLRVKFGIPASTPRPVAIVLSKHPAVLVVDTVLDLVRIKEAAVRRVPKQPEQEYRKYVAGVWRGRSRPCFLLDLRAIIPEELAAIQSPLADLLARHSVQRQR